MSRFLSLAAALLFCLFSFQPCLAQQESTVDFVKDIKPLFENYCIACHGPSKKEDFRIDMRDNALDYVIPEDSESSDLYLYMISEEEDELMPPADAHNPLSPKQIVMVKTWIDEGAEWPDDVGEWNDIPLPDAGKDAEAANAEQQRALNAVGSLHPAAVHLPIGLLLAAGLFAFLSLRGNFVMSDCAYYCLWLGALGAVAACVSGWFFSPMEGYGAQALDGSLLDQKDPMFMHRTSGIVCTICALILALFAASARNRDPDDGTMWKLGLILLACGIGFVGHEGGELHYGENHYEDLNAVFNSFFDDGEGTDDPKAEGDGGGESESNEGQFDEESDIGTSSETTYFRYPFKGNVKGDCEFA